MNHVSTLVSDGEGDKLVPAKQSRNMDGIRKTDTKTRCNQCKGIGHTGWTKTCATPKTWDWLFN